MTFLLDQNISFKILKLLPRQFEGSVHVSDVGLTNASDLRICNYAKSHQLVIVTFDYDFYDISILKKPPPKIILLKGNNKNSRGIAQALLNSFQKLQEFLEVDEFRHLKRLEIFL